jgi:hypothetical protein
MGKQRNEMARIFKRKREKARKQVQEVRAGKRTHDKLNRLARKLLAKSIKAAAGAKAAGRSS